MTKHEGLEHFKTHTEHVRHLEDHERQLVLKCLEEELSAFMQEIQQSKDAKEMLAKAERGDSLAGTEQFLKDHPRFFALTRAFLLATSLVSATGGGYLFGRSDPTEQATIEYVLKKRAAHDVHWESQYPKEKMQVVEAIEGTQWTHAPAIPAMPDLDAPPQIVEVHWDIKEGKSEIAPGQTYNDFWTIEGTAPGPVLRLKVGDVMRLKLTNTGTMPHNIDFHAITGPGGGGNDLLVEPGETAIIEARMIAPGFFQYHCAPAEYGPEMIAQHMANGMSGAVMVQPLDKTLPINQPVDHEWYVAQNEWYGQASGKKGELDFDMKAGMARHPSHIVFNGKVGALTDEGALHAKVGERARLYVLDSGPNLPSNFHVIGMTLDKVYRDGGVLNDPERGIGTTIIPPGGTSIVEMTFRVPESAKIVTHDIFSLAQGAIGEIKVIGPANPEIYQSIKKGSE